MRLSYRVWHALHSVLSVIIVVTGLAHSILVSYFTQDSYELEMWKSVDHCFVVAGDLDTCCNASPFGLASMAGGSRAGGGWLSCNGRGKT
jgi:hypothetical protein